MERINLSKRISLHIKPRSIFNYIISFKLYFALTAVFISVASLSLAQLQLNFGGSGYGYALNKDELNYDPYGEYGTEYQTSQYLNLGVCYMLNERNYFGIEASAQQSIFDGYSINMSVGMDPMIPLRPEYTAYNYSRRFGLRYTRIFLPNKKIRPILSVSVQQSKEYKWVEKGDQITYIETDNGIELKREQYSEVYKMNSNNLYLDFRIGAAYHFSDHFSLSLALEFSSASTIIWRSMFNQGVEKYEMALPFTVHYQF